MPSPDVSPAAVNRVEEPLMLAKANAPFKPEDLDKFTFPSAEATVNMAGPNNKESAHPDTVSHKVAFVASAPGEKAGPAASAPGEKAGAAAPASRPSPAPKAVVSSRPPSSAASTTAQPEASADSAAAQSVTSAAAIALAVSAMLASALF
ncbi:hypothetical protein IWQ56_006252 [Coemansia nantahalensis]|nr:hypothetical protein IWQ56_006252 [Coemansia nantahalensis]